MGTEILLCLFPSLFPDPLSPCVNFTWAPLTSVLFPAIATAPRPHGLASNRHQGDHFKWRSKWVNDTTQSIMDTTENIGINPQNFALEARSRHGQSDPHTFPRHTHFPGTARGPIPECFLWLAWLRLHRPSGEGEELSLPGCCPHPVPKGTQHAKSPAFSSLAGTHKKSQISRGLNLTFSEHQPAP